MYNYIHIRRRLARAHIRRSVHASSASLLRFADSLSPFSLSFFSPSPFFPRLTMLICLRNLVFSYLLRHLFYPNSRHSSLFRFDIVRHETDLPNFINSRTPGRQMLNVAGHATLETIGLHCTQESLHCN